MPLEEYRAKRDFSATPEPSGGAPSPDARIFVIQQHHARAMHWDFRLELDGVLLSWAVPKGPSYDPKDKRLAVHVEDHPIDYAGFEGVIPEGEYGAGKVIVWDRGTWEPITDPHAGLAKGDFKFRLAGEKLVGGWVLVRLKPRPGEKRDNWLLIKERDDMVRPSAEFDVTRDMPLSVISGVRVDDVDSAPTPATPQPTPTPPAEKPAPTSARPEHAAAPPDLALCTLVSAPPAGDGWLGEVKYDGYRVTVTLDRGSVTCHSRNGGDLTDKLPQIAQAVAALPAESAILDGEAVVFDQAGVSHFGALQKALSGAPQQIAFVAFDLLELNGHDTRQMPLTTRKELLHTLLAQQPAASVLRIAEYVMGDVPALLEVACAEGLEGVVAKRADGPYPQGRTRDWLKIKCRRSQEFVVGGWTEPKGTRTGFGALLLGVYSDGALVHAGRVGSGFDGATLDALAAQLRDAEQDVAPFDPPPEIPGAHWVRPELVAQVAFAEWTTEGVLRQPSFLGLRTDKDPATIVREVPEPAARNGAPSVEPPAAAAAAAAAAAVGTASSAPPDSTEPATVGGVRISNPAKKLFPESELTKLELARYYETVAHLMLPEVAHRPLTLVRCPVGNGSGTCFYQRHPDRGLSAHVQPLAHALAGHDEADEWLTIDSAAGLIALAQMGVAEIHTWLSRTDAPSRPDRLIFDLDPAPDVAWSQLVEAALLVRDHCMSLGFTPLLKSTGGKGLHVVIPVEPVWEFVRMHALARLVAEQIAAIRPDGFTTKMSKSARPGRVFLDYVRNSESASAVAPYSTRFAEGPTVSVPLEWSELDATDDLRARFTPAVVLERIASGIDPWALIDDSAAGVRVLKAAEGRLPMD